MPKLKSICKVCELEFEYQSSMQKGIYCSKKCRYADHSNVVKSGYTDELKEKKRSLALKQMKDPKQIAVRKEKLKDYRPSEEAQRKAKEVNTIRVDYRQIAINAHGNNCQKCGKTVSGNSLIVHHINGEHYIDELTDNSPENLMVLCRKCHTTLHWEQKDFIERFTGLTQFERAANNILDGLKRMGFKLDDANFKDTPKRMARAYREIFDGVKDKDQKIKNILATAFPSEEYNDIIIDSGITAYSMCPHHLLPVEYKVAIAYIPDKQGKVLGISKLSRIADLLAKQPALQEDYTQQIMKAIDTIKPQGVGVLVIGRHLCMRMRGVKSQTASITTSAVSGCFKTSPEARAELMSLLNTDAMKFS
jgi:GTP cyclohydrolase I